MRNTKWMAGKVAKDVDSYIVAAPKDVQAKLKQMRSMIRSVAPASEEVISYGIPMYKAFGKHLVGFAGFKKHVSLFAANGTYVKEHKEDFKDYGTSKGTIRFPLDQKLPVALIRKLVKMRLAENEKKAQKITRYSLFNVSYGKS